MARRKLLAKGPDADEAFIPIPPIVCPHCNSVVVTRVRRFNKAMAEFVLFLYRIVEGGTEDMKRWIHVPTEAKRRLHAAHILQSREYPRTAYFGVVEAMAGQAPDGNPHRGFYRLTDAGIAFARSEGKVAAYCLRRNGKTIGFAERHIDIHQALGGPFHYDNDIKEDGHGPDAQEK